jgi:hypothetical protein
MFVATLAVAGWLAYAAYDDLAMRQKEMAVSQGKVLESIIELKRDVGREIKELKSHLDDAMRAGSADEIKLLRNVESSVRRLEERMKAKKH